MLKIVPQMQNDKWQMPNGEQRCAGSCARRGGCVSQVTDTTKMLKLAPQVGGNTFHLVPLWSTGLPHGPLSMGFGTGASIHLSNSWRA